MENSEDICRALSSAGFALNNADEPGIYVRRSETLDRDSIDWQSEPTELLRELDRYIEGVRKQVGSVG